MNSRESKHLEQATKKFCITPIPLKSCFDPSRKMVVVHQLSTCTFHKKTHTLQYPLQGILWNYIQPRYQKQHETQCALITQASQKALAGHTELSDTADI